MVTKRTQMRSTVLILESCGYPMSLTFSYSLSCSIYALQVRKNICAKHFAAIATCKAMVIRVHQDDINPNPQGCTQAFLTSMIVKAAGYLLHLSGSVR